jgi:transposase
VRKCIIYQGVDLPRKFFNYFSVNERTGEFREGKVFNDDAGEIKEYLDMFEGCSKVAVEGGRNWYWFVDMLQERGIEVVLSNPKQTKAIAWGRKKGDKVDARMRCHLLRANILPTCWVPEKEMRDIREIVRYRMKLVRLRTQMKNMIHSYLSKQNVSVPFKSIWTGEGREWLEGMELKYPPDEMKRYCLRFIDSVTEVIEKYDEKLKKIGYRPEGIELIESIP